MPGRVVRSLEVGASFFYEALWPILLGVLITAAIETFVDTDRMADVLGGRDPVTAGKATGLGALSSACTFGAVTISHPCSAAAAVSAGSTRGCRRARAR